MYVCKRTRSFPKDVLEICRTSGEELEFADEEKVNFSHYLYRRRLNHLIFWLHL